MTLALSTVRMARQPALAGMKHLNRLEQVLAFAAKPAGADEVLLGDALGRPLSLSCMNLYARFGDTLWTPDVTQTGAAAGVAGVVRHLILKEWLPASGLVVSHKPCSLSRLCHADEVFASNAVAGVLPISKLGLSGWQAGSACRHFQSCFEQLVK
jgi:4-amino-4-deoxychorismate lyase